MAEIKLLNKLIIIENIFCIYRNYYKHKKFARFLILTYIFLRILFCILVLFIHDKIMHHRVHNGDYFTFYLFQGLHILTNLNTFIGIIGSIIFTDSFKSFSNHINWSYSYCKRNIDADKYMIKLIVFCIFCGICITAFTSLNFVNKSLWVSNDVNLYFEIVFTVAETIVQATFIGEHVVFFACVMLINLMLKVLNESIINYQKTLYVKKVLLKSAFYDSKNQILIWATMYQHIVICAQQLTTCFGKQLLISMVTDIINKVVIIYQMTTDIVRNGETKYHFTTNLVIVLCFYVSAMVLIMIGGQMVHNQMLQLIRTLAGLYNTMVAGPTETEPKRLKDLMRLMKNYPVQIKLVSTVPLGLYLLPIILSLAVNYIIIILQFNHVI